MPWSSSSRQFSPHHSRGRHKYHYRQYYTIPFITHQPPIDMCAIDCILLIYLPKEIKIICTSYFLEANETYDDAMWFDGTWYRTTEKDMRNVYNYFDKSFAAWDWAIKENKVKFEPQIFTTSTKKIKFDNKNSNNSNNLTHLMCISVRKILVAAIKNRRFDILEHEEWFIALQKEQYDILMYAAINGYDTIVNFMCTMLSRPKAPQMNYDQWIRIRNIATKNGHCNILNCLFESDIMKRIIAMDVTVNASKDVNALTRTFLKNSSGI